MKLRHFIVATAAFVTFILAAPTRAQDVTITGVVEPLDFPFCLGATHQIECNSTVKLRSAAVDLSTLVGENVRLSVKPAVGVTPCQFFDVVSASPATATLTVCGNPVPGCPMRFRVGPTDTIGGYWLFASPVEGLTPLGPAKGTLLLGNPFFLVATGLTFGETAAVDVVLPNAPSLAGVEVFLQGARRNIGPIGPIELSNAACFTITGPSPPCFITPDC